MNYEIIEGPAFSGKTLWSWYPPAWISWLLPSVALNTAFQESQWFVEQHPADPRRFQVGHFGFPLRKHNLWVETKGSLLGRILTHAGSGPRSSPFSK